MYEPKWISLSQAHQRLMDRTGQSSNTITRALWTALADGAIRAEGKRGRRDGQPKRVKVDRYAFKYSDDIDDIQERIGQNEVINWDLAGLVHWEIEVHWEDAVKVLGGSKPQLELDFEGPLLMFQGHSVRLYAVTVQLAPQSMNILRELAEARVGSAGQEGVLSKQTLEQKYFPYRPDKKAVAQAVSKLRSELRKGGIDQAKVDDLIENFHGEGWRLTLEPQEIKLN